MEKGGQLVKLEVMRTQVLKHLRSKRGRSKGDVRREVMEKGGTTGSLTGKRSEEMSQSNTSSQGLEIPL